MSIRAVCVVVPVHDEEELLGGCLDALGDAVASTPRDVRVEVIVALDDCSDGSAVIAARSGFHVIELRQRRVGAARAAGLSAALKRVDDLDMGDVWTAHTDADSVVPPQWIEHQVALADSGADVVLGTVRPDFRDLSARQRAAWDVTHPPGVAHGTVHGANLGVRAAALLAVGGFVPLPVHEDADLVARLRASGAEVVAFDGARVRTSGRTIGRAPDGYARYLRDDLVPAAFGA